MLPTAQNCGLLGVDFQSPRRNFGFGSLRNAPWPPWQRKTNRRLGQKNLWELKIEWEHLFRTFLRGFRWKKWPRQATGENETKKKARRYEEPIIYSVCGLCHVQIIESLLLDNFSLRSHQMVPNYIRYPYKYLDSISETFAPNFEQIDISPTMSAITSITVACILIDKLKLSRWPAIG